VTPLGKHLKQEILDVWWSRECVQLFSETVHQIKPENVATVPEIIGQRYSREQRGDLVENVREAIRFQIS
jgi:hypothetical protein